MNRDELIAMKEKIMKENNLKKCAIFNTYNLEDEFIQREFYIPIYEVKEDSERDLNSAVEYIELYFEKLINFYLTNGYDLKEISLKLDYLIYISEDSLDENGHLKGLVPVGDYMNFSLRDFYVNCNGVIKKIVDPDEYEELGKLLKELDSVYGKEFINVNKTVSFSQLVTLLNARGFSISGVNSFEELVSGMKNGEEKELLINVNLEREQNRSF